MGTWTHSYSRHTHTDTAAYTDLPCPTAIPSPTDLQTGHTQTHGDIELHSGPDAHPLTHEPRACGQTEPRSGTLTRPFTWTRGHRVTEAVYTHTPAVTDKGSALTEITRK